jgi:uncharacterized protein (DUF433 family)
MALAYREYTAAEAAAVSGVTVKSVHNAIDKKIVTAKPRRGVGARRVLTGDDLLRLKLWYGVGSTLSSERRLRLFEAIKATPQARTVKADDLLIVDVAQARKQIDAKVLALEEAEAAIHRKKEVLGGEPVFKGTRVPVRTVAAMLAQGASEDEILEGYPALNLRKLELARVWTAAHPARGRPKKLEDFGMKPRLKRRLVLKGDPKTRASRTPS